jgi:tetratricopeptide (TPR) repeat protein
MKRLCLMLFALLISTIHLNAQKLSDLCEEDVAAVVATINGPCALKEDRKVEKVTHLDAKTDVRRKLLEGQQLQCGKSSANKKDKKPEDGCIRIYYCGNRNEIPITNLSPDWFSVVNVPDVLPREPTRPGGRSYLEPNFLRPVPNGPRSTKTTDTAYVFRPENPEASLGSLRPVEGIEEIERVLAVANYHRNIGRLSEAMKFYGKVIEKHPSDPRAIVGMGNIYADLGKWEEAEQSYRRAVATNPSLASAYSSLSYVLLQSSRDSGRLQLAEASARQAIRLEPANAVAYDLLGVTLELQGQQSDEAEEAYKKALRIKPDFATAHLHLSRLLLTQGKYKEAELHYAYGLSLTADPEALLLVAERLQDESLFQMSEAPLNRVLTTEPENASALYLLAKALVHRKQYADGVQILKRASQMAPVKFEARRLLGFSYLNMNQPEDAEEAFDSAAKIAWPDQRKLLIGRSGLAGVAWLYRSLNRPADALRIERKIVTVGFKAARIKPH